MSDQETTLSAEQLLEHGKALRHIVRALVDDEHDVDDLVQESYLATLRGRPPRGRVGAWMRGVARKLSFMHQRSTRRRREREAVAAQRSADEPRPDVDGHAELLSHIAREVRRLREPFRTAIVMRYWQDLPPRKISAALGVPLDTVRSRLRAALAELRGRLDRRHGGRAAWTRALLGLDGPTRSSGLGLLTAAGLGLGAVAGGAGWWSAPDAVPVVVADAGSVAPIARRSPADGRPPQSAPDRAQADVRRVSGRCLQFGSRQPVAAARVRLVTDSGRKKRRGPWTTCDAQGRFAARGVDPGRGAMAWLEAAAPDRANLLVRLGDRRADQDLGDVLLPRGLPCRGVVVDEAGAPIPDVRLRIRFGLRRLIGADLAADFPAGWEGRRGALYSGSTSNGSTFSPLGEAYARTGARGEFRLAGCWLGPGTDGQQPHIENLERCKLIRFRELDTGAALQLEVVMRRPADLPHLSGTLTTPSGTPIAGARIVATSRDWSEVVTQTDAGGRFTLVKSEGGEIAEEVALSLPPVLAGGYVPVVPSGSFAWGRHDIALHAEPPTEVTLAEHGVSLADCRLHCTTFVDEGFDAGGQYGAERVRGGERTAVFLVARGVSHLVLVPPRGPRRYLGLHRIGARPVELPVADHRIEVRARTRADDPVRNMPLDCVADFAGCGDPPALGEVGWIERVGDGLDLRTDAHGRCVLLLGFPPERCRVRFLRWRWRPAEPVRGTGPVQIVVPR